MSNFRQTLTSLSLLHTSLYRMQLFQNAHAVKNVKTDVISLISRLEAVERERDELRAEQAEHDEQIARMESKFSLAKRALDSKTARCEKAEAELRRRDTATGEPLSTQLVYSSALPKFIGDTDEIESYSCFISGETPPRKTMTEAYADAKKVCGELYTAALPAVLPPEVTEPVGEYCLDDREGLAWLAGANWMRQHCLELGAQQQKVVVLPNVYTWSNSKVVYFAALKQALDAAGVKWEVKS